MSGSSEDGYVTALEESDLEDGEIPTRPDQREPVPPQGSQTPKRPLAAEANDLCAKTTPTKKFKLEMQEYAVHHESGSMWDQLRCEWTRIERPPRRSGEHKHDGLGYKGFLSSRKDTFAWVSPSEV